MSTVQCDAKVPAILPYAGALPKQEHDYTGDCPTAQHERCGYVSNDHSMVETKQKVCRGVGYQVEYRVAQHIGLQMQRV